MLTFFTVVKHLANCQLSTAKMVVSHSNSKSKSYYRVALRYWLVWALVVAALFYAMHRYFEYRNCELDKRLEQLQAH